MNASVDFMGRTRSLIVIELERAWRTRTTWVLAGAMVVVTALVTFGATHQAALPGSGTAAGAATTAAAVAPPVQELRMVLSGIAALRIFVVLLGILCVTTEYQHGDIVWRFLAEPSRAVVIAAKAGACAVIGALLGIVTLQIGTLIEIGFGGPGATFGLSSGEAIHAVAGAVLSAALAGVLGVGIGAAVRNQTAAVVGALVGVLLVEPMLGALVPRLSAYLPTAAAAAASGHAAALGWLGGLILSFAYAALAVVGGSVLCIRRDV